MVAGYLDAPEWVISEGEAKTLVSAAQEVGKLHNLPSVPPELRAYGLLALALGGVYGPRIALTWRSRGRRRGGASVAPGAAPGPLGDAPPGAAPAPPDATLGAGLTAAINGELPAFMRGPAQGNA